MARCALVTDQTGNMYARQDVLGGVVFAQDTLDYIWDISFFLIKYDSAGNCIVGKRSKCIRQ